MDHPLQVQLIPEDFEELEEKDIEFFLSRDRPILGIDAKPHPNPQVISSQIQIKKFKLKDLKPLN